MGIAYNPRIVTDGLVLALDAGNVKSYPGSGTTWTNLSGIGNTGSLTNGPTYSSANGGSIVFDGVDDYISLTPSIGITSTNGWTISSWVYLSSSGLSTSNLVSLEGDTIFYNATNPRDFGPSLYSPRAGVGAFATKFGNTTYISIGPTGSIYVASQNTKFSNPKTCGFFKFNSDGSLNTTFNIGENGYYTANPFAIKESTYYPQKVYIGCNESSNPNGPKGFRRHNSDGSIDTSFNFGGSGFNSVVYDFVEDSSGKLYVVGLFTEYNGVSANGIIKLNQDGSIDTSFNFGTGFSSTAVYGIKLDSSGKIYVYGGFTAYNGTTAVHIVKLNTNGSIDSSFSSGTGTNTYVDELDIDLTSGRIYIVGSFTSYNGTSANRIVGLTTTGSIDSSFNVGTGFANATYALKVDQTTRKVYAGGTFTGFNGSAPIRIARLNTDGSLDTSFDSISGGFTSYPTYIEVDSSGNVYAAGNFVDYKGTATSSFIKLNNTAGLVKDFFDDVNYEVTRYFVERHSSAGLVPITSPFSTIQKPYTFSDIISIFYNKWYYRTITMNPNDNTIKIYHNNTNILSANILVLPNFNCTSIGFGVNSSYYYNGNIANTTIYNRALTASEVQQNFNALRGRFGI